MIHGDFADIASVYEERDRDLALARLWPHPISLDFLISTMFKLYFHTVIHPDIIH